MRGMPATAVPPSAVLASQISEELPARLEAARQGRIHSIYRAAINVALPGGDLFVIADPGLGGLPDGVLVDLGPDRRTLGLERGQLVVASERFVALPAVHIRIWLHEAVRWTPRMPIAAPGAARRWRHRTAAVRDVARARTAGASAVAALGLGGLLDGVGSHRLPIHAARTAAVLDQLEAAFSMGRIDTAGQIARRIVGLGPGMTPSGDDALIGLAAALWAIDHPCRGFLADAVDDAAVRTTAVSVTLLRHAAAGEFSERLQRLLAALLGDDEAAIEPAVERAMAWGATSGTDCLVGVLFGLDIVTARTPRVAPSAR